tara:strand:+ start:1343 stop:1828 length:486 start_codon:yes stop_codon:yes gene_type:complete
MELVTPGFGLVFWMVLSFGVVLFILKKYAWKPILKSIEDRNSFIKKSLESAEEAKKEMENLQADNESILREAKIERDKLLKEGRDMKESIINSAKQEAQSAKEKIVNEANESIENMKKAAITEINNQIATISVEIAEKLLKEELKDETKNKEHVLKLIENR